RPQAAIVGADDRAADGQAHPDAVILGGKEGFEDRFGIGDAVPGVADLDRDVVTVGGAADPQLPLRGTIGHRVPGVDDQVEDDLLELHAVGDDRWNAPSKLQVDRDLAGGQVRALEPEHFEDALVHVDFGAFDPAPQQQSP